DLPAFMRIAVDVDVKIASLEGLVLRLAQLGAGRNSELVVGFLLQRNYNGTVLARSRLMNMCGRGLDACGSDTPADRHIFVHRNRAVTRCLRLHRRHLLVAAQLHFHLGRKSGAGRKKTGHKGSSCKGKYGLAMNGSHERLLRVNGPST